MVKHNVLHGCKLFLDVYREVAAEFPDVAQDVAIVDSFAVFMLLPESYDVVVSTNMFGDILTDLGSVLQGGLGMAVGCNVGDDHAMFERPAARRRWRARTSPTRWRCWARPPRRCAGWAAAG